MIHWHVIYVTKSAIHLSFVKKNKNNNHENNSSTQVLIREDYNVCSNALSCNQEKITIPEKINNTQDNNTNLNSTHEIISTYEKASGLQDSTNLIKPPVPKIVTRTPNEPIKRPSPLPSISSSTSSTPQHIEQQIRIIPKNPKPL